MRYLALVTDYDGTLASHDRVSEQTVRALERLRVSGRRAILVTGRRLDDLLAVCTCARLFDLIVAENGAIVYDPRRPRRDATRQPAVQAAAARAAGARRRAARDRAGARGDARAASRSRAGRRLGTRSRGAGDRQSRRGHGAPGRRQQGDRPRVRAAQTRAFAPRGGGHRRRGKRSFVSGTLRVRRGGGQRGSVDQGDRRLRDDGRKRRRRYRADRRVDRRRFAPAEGSTSAEPDLARETRRTEPRYNLRPTAATCSLPVHPAAASPRSPPASSNG